MKYGRVTGTVAATSVPNQSASSSAGARVNVSSTSTLRPTTLDLDL